MARVGGFCGLGSASPPGILNLSHMRWRPRLPNLQAAYGAFGGLGRCVKRLEGCGYGDVL